MIRLTDIRNALFPLVGWRQGLTPVTQIGADLQQSESGLYYDGAHPLVTLANILSVQENENGVLHLLPKALYFDSDPGLITWTAGTADYAAGEFVNYNSRVYMIRKSFHQTSPKWPDDNPDLYLLVEIYKALFDQWYSGIEYEKGAIVTSGGKFYRSLQDNNTNHDPWHTAEGYWEEFTPASKDELFTITWAVNMNLQNALRRYMEDGIATMVNRFIADKQLTKETRSLLERRTFFDGAARLQATIAPTGKLCGFEIIPVRSMGVTTKIERIGLQMVGNTGSVTLYLFHSSQVAPMRMMTFNYTNTSGGFQWFVPAEDLYLPYIGSGNDSGGAWLLCYNQNDLPVRMRALNVSKDWSKEPCATCSGYSLESWREITKYLQVSPFCTDAPEGFAQDPQMPDIGELGYTNTMNYGMNVEVSVQCDLTDFIVSQRSIFAPVLQKQVAANILRTLAMNPDVRVNRNQANVTRDGMLYELDGNPQGRAGGLVYELERLYKALSLDTRGLDRICLQCNNGGVRYRSV